MAAATPVRSSGTEVTMPTLDKRYAADEPMVIRIIDGNVRLQYRSSDDAYIMRMEKNPAKELAPRSASRGGSFRIGMGRKTKTTVEVRPMGRLKTIEQHFSREMTRNSHMQTDLQRIPAKCSRPVLA